MALTATAAPETQTNICQSLGLTNPVMVLSSLNRPNIFYSVRAMKGYRVRMAKHTLYIYIVHVYVYTMYMYMYTYQ